MSLTPKIEDILNQKQPVSSTEAADEQGPHTSFTRVLDYSFPKTVPDSKVKQVGEVIYSGDGVVYVSGLSRAKVEDILHIHTKEGVEKAIILGISETRVEAVVVGDYTHVSRGDMVQATGSRLQVPVGKELFGRVINPLGQPLDGLGPVKPKAYRNVEFMAPGVVDRMPIETGLLSGIMAIDAMIPVGHGQRELVIGDRKTGKSRTMLDYISNQKGRNVACIYVGVGIQAAKAKATLELLTKRGAMSYTTIVAALSDDPPTLQYLAPYAGAALGEHFMYNGGDSLVIYDDLTKQAKAYRQVSLLLKRSPGRDAYPGDIFFLHSRLLERGAKMAKHLGAGSMTALPVAETQQGDVSDYIVTNLMSITDGHILLDAEMMNEGITPAINTGDSVSRVGGKAQSKLMQKVGELTARILARYEEVKSFETINTEVTAETMTEIKRGRTMRELMSQNSEMTYAEDEQIVYLGIGATHRLDPLELDEVPVYIKNFLPFYRSVITKDLQTAVLSATSIKEIDEFLDTLTKGFMERYSVGSARSGQYAT